MNQATSLCIAWIGVTLVVIAPCRSEAWQTTDTAAVIETRITERWLNSRQSPRFTPYITATSWVRLDSVSESASGDRRLYAALRAHTLYKRDVNYLIEDGKVVIIDEFTGRKMPGRRWSDGLHQAIEAKEGVDVEEENQTVATVTYQNFFRMYKKLAGMTGTADTEATEFKKIYKLDVVVVPTHKQMIRIDHPDMVYRSEQEKFNAVVQEIQECYEKGQPVLVGTTSVEKSERLSRMLKKEGIRHNVLNAVNHEAEASIIAQAGR